MLRALEDEDPVLKSYNGNSQKAAFQNKTAANRIESKNMCIACLFIGEVFKVILKV